MTCKIKGCQNPVYGHGLCAKHYFRQRRHGDTEVTHKPGPKPKLPPKPEPEVTVAKGLDSSAEDARLRTLLARADAEIAELRRWQADTQQQARAQPAAAQNTNVEELQRKNASLQYQVNKLSAQLKEARTVEYRRLQADRDQLRTDNRLLRAQLAEAKKPRSESQEVAKLQRQLKAMQTRAHNLTLEKNTEWRAAREARDANPAAITKANLNKLRKVFHPDLEARVSQERKAELTAASQIFNRLKFKVIG